MNKNDIYTVTIEDMSEEGEGIGRIDGYTLFVKDAIVGDEAVVRLTKLKKTYGYARLESLVTPSPDRTTPRCPVARQCGGCQLQAMTYEAQLAFKKNKVAQNLKRLGGIQVPVKEVLGMEHPWDYRNKTQLPVGQNTKGEAVCGFYAGRTHVIIPQEACAIADPVSEKLASAVMAYVRENRVPLYDETAHTGLLRHILIRTASSTGEIMVCLIINGERLPKEERLVEKLLPLGVTSISVNKNTRKDNVILGTETRAIHGGISIRDSIGDLFFKIHPLSFFQVNPTQTKVLYETALSYAKLTGKETVWDLYCGIGTISLFLARKAKKVYGVEIVPEAIENAKENARDNQIENAEFLCGKAEEVVPSWVKEHPEARADVVVVDPPRKGCEETLLSCILTLSPARIVYVSCNSATLARDLKFLTAGGYEVKEVQPVDMFPHTAHVETVVQLSKGDIDRGSSERSDAVKAGDFGMISGYSKGNKASETTNVKIDFSLENLDLSELRGKATYEQIKDYVREQTGFRVSTLYISQVKRKCGLEVGKSYNKPKSEDAKQPQCTPEKEEAIMQALRHFGMM